MKSCRCASEILQVRLDDKIFVSIKFDKILSSVDVCFVLHFTLHLIAHLNVSQEELFEPLFLFVGEWNLRKFGLEPENLVALLVNFFTIKRRRRLQDWETCHDRRLSHIRTHNFSCESLSWRQESFVSFIFIVHVINLIIR